MVEIIGEINIIAHVNWMHMEDELEEFIDFEAFFDAPLALFGSYARQLQSKIKWIKYDIISDKNTEIFVIPHKQIMS